MKLLDEVKVVSDKEEYKKEKVSKGMIGTIIDAEIRFNSFQVGFVDLKIKKPNFDWENEKWDDDIVCYIKIEDLEVIKESNITDEYLLSNLPDKYPNWWCKVEDGYIVNLKGEKKNKIPYDYNS